MIGNFFYVVFYQPLFNLLIFLYNTFGDLGIAVILITLIVKGALYPISAKATKSQKELKKLQPKVKELQEKYEDDKEKQAEKVLELYSEHNVSPFSGIFPLLLQFPIIISLFQIFRRGLGAGELVNLYDFIHNPEVIDYLSFGILDLGEPNMILAVLAGIGQFIQVKITMSSPDNDEKESESGFGSIMKSQMKYALPIFTVFILSSLPSAVGVYWIITVIFSVVQHKLVK
ncbi:MAG: YidC/Oxa1 family membrane protein insertase [Patescibacteria group bacterium]